MDSYFEIFLQEKTTDNNATALIQEFLIDFSLQKETSAIKFELGKAERPIPGKYHQTIEFGFHTGKQNETIKGRIVLTHYKWLIVKISNDHPNLLQTAVSLKKAFTEKFRKPEHH